MKALAVHRWPGPTPTPQDGLFAILIHVTDVHAADVQAADVQADAVAGAATGNQRDAARRQIRRATRQALAAFLNVSAEDIAISSVAGTPPDILIAGETSRIGCSFSHDGDYSLAAINLHGPIGADMMRIQDIPDWEIVARDYLGPGVAAWLKTAADRPGAFTQVWTRREAALKYQQQQLSEWLADIPGTSISLTLPVAGLTGHLHIGD